MLDFVIKNIKEELGEGVTVFGRGEGCDSWFDVVPWLLSVFPALRDEKWEKKGILTRRFRTCSTGEKHVPNLEPLLQLVRLLVFLAVLSLESRPLDCIDAFLLGWVAQFARVAFFLVF